MSNAQHSYQLLEFMAALSERSVPAQVLRQAQECFVDTIGVGLFGATQPWSRMLAENTFAESAPGRCTVFGRTEALAPAPAGLVNGTAVHGFELDDLVAEASGHPGAVAVPAALAAAEHGNASGRRLLLGIVAGYETMARVGYALGLETSHRGFHVTGVAGPVAATVAAGVTLGLPLATLRGAVGLACSASSGIKSFARGDGGMVKRMHVGRSVEAGLRSCQLAERGFTGPQGAIDGKFGLLEVFGGGAAQPERLTQALGSRWAFGDVWTKVYPVCGQIQGAVQLLTQLRGHRPLSARQIGRVRVGVSGYAGTNNGNPAPVDTMGAQYSLPYCAAVSLLADPNEPSSFAEAMIAREDVRALARRVEVFVDAKADALYPKRLATRVELELDDGAKREGEVLDAHGSPADPCSYEEREAKFRRLAAYAKSGETVDRLIELMRRLDGLASIAPLSAALRA